MKKDFSISISAADLQLNLIDLYDKYELMVISAFDWAESTQKAYRNMLESASKHLVDIPFCDCITDDFDRAFENLNKKRRKPYSDNTIKGFRSVFKDFCHFCEVYSHGLYSSVVWGSDWKAIKKSKRGRKSTKDPDEDELKDQIERMTVLPRSLTMNQELKLVKEINDGIENNSYYAGVACLYYLGLRPGECSGVTFGDIRPLEGHPDTYCIYIYEQISDSGKVSNDLKTLNAYRVLPVPKELYYLLSKRRAAVEKRLNGNCDNCYIICANETIEGLRRPCNRRKFRISAQNLLRRIKVEERVVINMSEELKSPNTSESNATTYLLRRNFATALLSVCGMNDDELKYMMGHAIGAADEKRHDFVNPDILFHLWQKLNLRSFLSPYKTSFKISSRGDSLLVRQKEANIEVMSSALDGGNVYLSIFNEFPNDYIRVKSLNNTSGVDYRSSQEPSELKKIGRIFLHNEFEKSLDVVRKRMK